METTTVSAISPVTIPLTSNGARELSDALRRRCLHLHIPYPEAALERQIVQTRVPELAPYLATRLVAFVHGLRALDLKKHPAVSETLDWARTLVLLNADELGEDLVRDTLTTLLKHEEDVATALAALPQVMQVTRNAAQVHAARA